MPSSNTFVTKTQILSYIVEHNLVLFYYRKTYALICN
jgi:hypothetical protein